MSKRPYTLIVAWCRRVLAPLAAAIRRLGPVTPAKAALAAAALVALVVFAVLLWPSGDADQPAAVAQPSATPTARRTPKPTSTQQVSPSPSVPAPTPTPSPPTDPSRVFANLPPPMEEQSIQISPGSSVGLVGGIYRVSSDGTDLVRLAGPDDPAAGSHFAFSVRSLSADGRWLAFAVRTPTNRATRGEPVFLKDLTNSAPARPLAVFGRVRYLAISPDGQRLIVDGAVDLPVDPGYVDTSFYVIDVEEHTISALPQLADAYGVVWSPTGGHLAFQRSGEPGGGSSLFVARADWSDIRELPATEGAVAWSPDGSQLALAACCGMGIHIATPDGGNRFLTYASPHSSPYLPSPLAWSPDGKRLAFHSYDKTLGGSAITVVNTETASLEALGSGSQPAWSRDGSQIAFTRDGHLFVMRSAGGQSTQITNPVQPFVDSPQWASTDSGVLFHFAPWFLRSIRLVGASGDEQHLAYGDHPVWSPDGSRIAFIGRVLSAGLAGTNEMYVMNADGSGVHKVGQYSWADVGTCPEVLAWSTDGNYVRFTGSQGVLLAPADGSSPQQRLDEPCPPNADQRTDNVYSPDRSALLVVR
jgi:Tol biopolymer transport system component